MSDLQIALKEAGLLDIVEAKAKELGTTIEGAIRSLQDVCSEQAGSKLKPGTVAFYDAVCAELNPNDKRGYVAWKEEAERVAGHPLLPTDVQLYAYCGKTCAAEASLAELTLAEEAIDRVLGQ